MHRMKSLLWSAVFTLLSAWSVAAAPINFVYEFSDVSGILGETEFENANVRLQALTDNGLWRNEPDGFSYAVFRVNLAVEGVGSVLLTGVNAIWRFHINTNTGLASFLARPRASFPPSEVASITAPEVDALKAWDPLDRSDSPPAFGPYQGSFAFDNWGPAMIDKYGSPIFFDDQVVDGQFTIVVPSVPLPAAGWMLLAGIGGLGALRTFRKG